MKKDYPDIETIKKMIDQDQTRAIEYIIRRMRKRYHEGISTSWEAATLASLTDVSILKRIANEMKAEEGYVWAHFVQLSSHFGKVALPYIVEALEQPAFADLDFYRAKQVFLEALSKIYDNKSVSLLVGYLTNPSFKEQEFVIYLLNNMFETFQISYKIIHRLNDFYMKLQKGTWFDNWVVRDISSQDTLVTQMTILLSTLKDDDALRYLLKLVHEKNNPYRIQIIEGLANYNQPEVIATLREIAADTENIPPIRVEALATLFSLGDKATVKNYLHDPLIGVAIQHFLSDHN